MTVVRFPLEERIGDHRALPDEPARVFFLPSVPMKNRVCPRCHGSQVVGMTMKQCPDCRVD